MTLREEKEPRAQLQRMAGVANVLWKCVFALGIVYALATIGLLVVFVNDNRSGFAEGQVATQVVTFVIMALIGVAVFYTLTRVFYDVAQSIAPFTMTNARRIGLIGALLLLFALLEAVGFATPMQFGQVEDVVLSYSMPPGTEMTHIDVKLIVAGILCFCLSYVFRYGACLQRLYDDTV